MSWDVLLILRPGLSREQRLRLLDDVLNMLRKDIDKGVDGGGTLFQAALTEENDGQGQTE